MRNVVLVMAKLTMVRHEHVNVMAFAGTPTFLNVFFVIDAFDDGLCVYKSCSFKECVCANVFQS